MTPGGRRARSFAIFLISPKGEARRFINAVFPEEGVIAQNDLITALKIITFYRVQDGRKINGGVSQVGGK